MGGEFSYILSLVACFDQWFVLCVEDLSRVHPIFCLFLFLFLFFLQLMSRSLSHRIMKAVLPSDQQDFWIVIMVTTITDKSNLAVFHFSKNIISVPPTNIT